MTENWGPALDAEIANRREDLVRAARRPRPTLPRPTREQRVQLRVLLAVRRAHGTSRTNSRTAVVVR